MVEKYVSRELDNTMDEREDDEEDILDIRGHSELMVESRGKKI